MYRRLKKCPTMEPSAPLIPLQLCVSKSADWHSSAAFVKTQIPGPSPRVSDSVGLGRGRMMCPCHRLPGEADCHCWAHKHSSGNAPCFSDSCQPQRSARRKVKLKGSVGAYSSPVCHRCPVQSLPESMSAPRTAPPWLHEGVLLAEALHKP